jgi:putative transferase (TIGR04331 family)
MRSRLVGIPASSGLEAVVTKLLPALLPMSALEAYGHVVEESRRLYGPGVNVVHGNYRWDEVQNEFIARCARVGRRVSFVQHGGSYGQLEVDTHRRLELRPETEFVSWGWRAPGVTPLPSLQLSQIRDRHRGGTAVPIIEGPVGRMLGHSRLVSVNGVLQDHQEQEVETFIAAIEDPGLQSQLIRKPFPTVNTSKLRLPSAVQLMTRARITVLTYFDTPLLEAFTANVPMIAFWHPDTYGVNLETASILDDMSSVGILHADPVAAAEALVRVYPQAQAWWSQDAVQDVRQRFIERFALSTGWREQWVPYLRGFAK